MTKKKLSIIIPVYNSENFIKKLLEQLAFLDKKVVEIIAIDDGSIDDSSQILYDMQAKMNNLIIISQSNQGVSAARNAGIRKAKGNFIFFVDSDDDVNIYALKKLISELNYETADIVFFGLIDRFIGKDKNTDIMSTTYTQTINKKEFLKHFADYLNQSIIYSPCNKIYKRDKIIKNDIFFNCNLTLGEDILFNLSYFSNCEKFNFKSDYIYVYNHFHDRKNTGSTKYLDNEIYISVLVLTSIEKYLLHENMLDVNRNNLNRFYIKRMNSLVFSLFSKTCTLNRKEKKKKILEVCKTPIFQEACKTKISDLEKKSCVLKFLYKKKMILFIYYLFKFFAK